MLNQTVRDYKIIKQIGAGGYGAVYQAHDTSVDRDVAIKIILPEYASDIDFKNRFEIEAKLVAQLEHPHIVPLYSYWQDEQGAFLVMRFVRGGNLRELLETQGALSLVQVERWLTHLAGALSVAHSAGVVHRDLKPDNILLDDLGNAYLTDFGIAKQINSPSHVTEADSIMGTWHYLSPEQIQSQPVSAQTDMYALGFMLYEMLTGTHPFKDDNIAMLVNKHLNESLPSILDLRADLPTELDDIIYKATAKDPTERYASTNDLLADFQKALYNETTSSKIQSVSELESVIRPELITPEDRNRYAMLDNVRVFWVQGVLEQSLYNAVWIELGMSERSEAVDNPWQSILKVPNSPDETLPSGIIISEVFDQLKGKLLILGEPGSGKTTTLLTLARDLLNRAEWDTAHPIPVVFNLSSWAENRKSLPDWMVDELNQKYQVPRKMGQAWVDGEQILPLLDGLDEVVLEHRNDCVDVINEYRTEHGFVDIVVCSRIADYEALTSKLRLNGAIALQPLQREQVDVYLAQAGDGLSAVLQVLQEDEKLRRLTTSPLMLNILTLAYRDMSVDEIQQFDTLEGRRKHLFETYVTRMLVRRGDDQTYSIEDTQKHLTWLAKNMSREALSVFHIEGLQSDWLDTRIQRGIYTLIAGAPVIFLLELLLFLLSVLFASMYNFSTLFLPVVGVPLIGLTYIVLAAFEIIPQFPNYKKSLSYIKPVERIRYSYPFRQVARSLFRAFLASSFASFLFTVIFVILNESIQNYNVIFGIPLGLMFGLVTIIYGLFLSIFSGFQIQEIEARTAPNQGIRLSAKNMVKFLVLAIVSVVTLFLVINIVAFRVLLVLLAVPLIFSFSAVWGGAAVYRHVILRSILRLSGQMPRNIARFLDYASSRILLRKVGGGYVFLHRMLLDYFANLDEEQDETSDDQSQRLARLTDEGDEAVDDDETDSLQQQANQ